MIPAHQQGALTGGARKKWSPLDFPVAKFWADPTDVTAQTNTSGRITAATDKVGGLSLASVEGGPGYYDFIGYAGLWKCTKDFGGFQITAGTLGLPASQSSNIFCFMMGIDSSFDDQTAEVGQLVGFGADNVNQWRGLTQTLKTYTNPPWKLGWNKQLTNNSGQDLTSTTYADGSPLSVNSYFNYNTSSSVTSEVRVNGVSRITRSTTMAAVSASAQRVMIGINVNNNANASAYIGTVLITSALTTAERDWFEAYVIWQHNQGASLDASHPYQTVDPRRTVLGFTADEYGELYERREKRYAELLKPQRKHFIMPEPTWRKAA